MAEHVEAADIRDWRSIVTLVVFVITNLIVLFPFPVSVYVPRVLSAAFRSSLVSLRVVSSGHDLVRQHGRARYGMFEIFRFPLNFVTAPILADLFLLAIRAIGRTEVYEGTIESNGISPIDIMIFFLSLAYIAISIDASGLIRYLAFKVLQKGGEVGHRLFFYLYLFFFSLGSFIGNDPIILSGTAFLAYMTRVSSNIIHPRAWIHTQFAIANIASAILVSSNPTNLVLAGAFRIRFVDYTANMVVPVIVTAIVLFPFLLYFIFADPQLIPLKIEMHELSDAEKERTPVNPNIPNVRGVAAQGEANPDSEQGQLLSLEEIMNPFLDKGGAVFGSVIMAATLITLLVLNAVSQTNGEYPVFYVTLPAAFVTFCWDVGYGWYHRDETRRIARQGRHAVQHIQAEGAPEEVVSQDVVGCGTGSDSTHDPSSTEVRFASSSDECPPAVPREEREIASGGLDEKREADEKHQVSQGTAFQRHEGSATLVSIIADGCRWCQETFPTVTAVLAHLPFALVPFAFAMFILVQALVTKGWVQVFAHGWDHWVDKTGTVGSIGGMGFLSVILCNVSFAFICTIARSIWHHGSVYPAGKAFAKTGRKFAGTNIGTTILLSRVIQEWQLMHDVDQGMSPISDRTFWATVYSMAIGVNYGAFSTAFSASLAGLLWRDILERKHIPVRRLEFARNNLSIIAIAMSVGCAVLVGQVYITRWERPYTL